MAKRAVIQKVKELLADTYRRAHESAKKHEYWRDVEFTPGPNHLSRYLKWCERNKLDPTVVRIFETYYGVWSLRAETGGKDKVSIENMEAILGPGYAPHKLYKIAYRDEHERRYLESEIEESKWAVLTANAMMDYEAYNYDTEQWDKKQQKVSVFKARVLVKYDTNVAGLTGFPTWSITTYVDSYKGKATITVNPSSHEDLDKALRALIAFADKKDYGWDGEKLLDVKLEPYVERQRRRRRKSRVR